MLKHSYRAIIFCLIAWAVQATNESNVRTAEASRVLRTITPPMLTDAHIGRKILCHRPMRQGTPRMAIETIDSQTIIHNYGHGESGWTLAPGAAQHEVGLLRKAQPQLDKAQEIAVLDAGTLGLFTALELHNRLRKHNHRSPILGQSDL